MLKFAENKTLSSPAPSVLIAPLNWGAGHATRMLPIINELYSQGFKVYLWTSSPLMEFFRETAPWATLINDKREPVKWESDNTGFRSYWKLAIKLLVDLKKDRKEIKSLHKEKHFDLIISDNRYGAHITNRNSILVTHQLALQLPKRLQQVSFLINYKIRQFYKPFTQLWVPDTPNNLLSGELSKKGNKYDKVKWIGPLSRYTLTKAVAVNHHFKIVVLLSGPEPAKSVWQSKLEGCLESLQVPACFIRTGNFKANSWSFNKHLAYLNNGTGNQIKWLLLHTPLVIARAGYSSIMDLFLIKKQAILVPTPGQSEQAYLASHLKNNKLFSIFEEDEITPKRLKEQLNKTIKKQGIPILQVADTVDTFRWKSYLKAQRKKHTAKPQQPTGSNLQK